MGVGAEDLCGRGREWVCAAGGAARRTPRARGSGRPPSGSHLSRNKVLCVIGSENCKVKSASWAEGPLAGNPFLGSPGRGSKVTQQSKS